MLGHRLNPTIHRYDDVELTSCPQNPLRQHAARR
jgi:hypothetical protein